MSGGDEYLRANDIARLTGVTTPDRSPLDCQRNTRLGEAWRRTTGGQKRA